LRNLVWGEEGKGQGVIPKTGVDLLWDLGRRGSAPISDGGKGGGKNDFEENGHSFVLICWGMGHVKGSA